ASESSQEARSKLCRSLRRFGEAWAQVLRGDGGEVEDRRGGAVSRRRRRRRLQEEAQRRVRYPRRGGVWSLQGVGVQGGLHGVGVRGCRRCDYRGGRGEGVA